MLFEYRIVGLFRRRSVPIRENIIREYVACALHPLALVRGVANVRTIRENFIREIR